jgi:hypothetical protein
MDARQNGVRSYQSLNDAPMSAVSSGQRYGAKQCNGTHQARYDGCQKPHNGQQLLGSVDPGF